MEGVQMKTYQDFMRDMRIRESSDNYLAKNRFGYLGAYQFGRERLYDLGFNIDGKRLKKLPMRTPISTYVFLNSPALQDETFARHIVLYVKVIEKKVGKKRSVAINGFVYNLDLSAMVAVAHLLGLGGLYSLLNGVIEKDGNGTKATEYARLFTGYDVSEKAVSRFLETR